MPGANRRLDRSTLTTMTSAPDFEETRAVPRSADDDSLPLATRLRDYEVTGLIGIGAFSIVYLAWDHSLQRKVAIKEYLPSSIAFRVDGTPLVTTSERHLDTFKAGLKSFVNEARLLASFDHPSLVKVYRFWEDNGTAYMVMPYHEGPTLKAALAELGHVPGEAELRIWLKPILNAVTVLHEGRTWHQNIGPDAILLTPTGPVLLGFASAAHAIEAIRHTPAAALRPGFAAIEQYGSEAGTTRGPCTDLYALAATVYAAITGADPAPAADRLAHDRVRPLSVVAAGLYSEGFLAAIDAAMTIQPQQRPADHAEFRALMGDIEAPEMVSLTPRRDLMQEPFLPPPDEDREVTVPDRPVVITPTETPKTRPPAVAVAARPARASPAGDAPAPSGGERGLPSWMTNGPSPAAGKRVLYGVVAGTCALIGIAALVLQFATRAGNHAPAAVAASSPAARASAPAAERVASAAPTILAPPPAAATASATPRAVAVPAPAPVVVARTPAPAPATRVAAASTPLAVPTDPIQRQARCIEILQKASLEKITAAETEYFKKECK
jgi:serine/threonine protein kinase